MRIAGHVDGRVPARHNGAVSGPVARIASGLVVAPFLLFGSSLAPLHVHESEAGHSHAVAHSHFEPHHLEAHDHDDAEIEQGGERVIWLDSAVLHQAPYQLSQAPACIAASFDSIAREISWSVTPFDDVAPVHGPPRGHPSFRGPPASLA